MLYGYARISTDGQSLAGQLAELEAYGCARTFKETASGARSDRAQLKRAMRYLADGDVLVVTRLDRLARSTRDLLNILAKSPSAAPASSPCMTDGPTPPRLTGG